MLHLYPPTYIGPTWKRDENGNFILPERTLGWEIAGWCSEYVLNPNAPEDDQTPWEFSLEQFRFLLWWYAVDENGEFIYRTGILQRLKGWGKDPLLAVIALVELLGPSRFAGWAADGSPIGEPHPAAWVQVVATSQAQTQNTFSLFPSLCSKRMRDEYSMEMGRELIRAHSGRVKLEAVTSSYRSLEGNRTTFTLKNETQHWVRGNSGKQMADTIRSNLTKGNNRSLSITNAYLPGEDSVAEDERADFTAIEEGRAPDVGLLYDSIEAHPETPLTPDGVRYAIPLLRGDSVWLDPESVLAEVLLSSVSPSRSRRMWFNQIVADEDALVSEGEWDKLGIAPKPLQDGDEIVLGFDGSRTQDATALVAIRVSDSYVQPLLIEESPENVAQKSERTNEDGPVRWEVNRDLVDSTVHEAFRRFKPLAFYADVELWESYIADWSRLYGARLKVQGPDRGGNSIAWDMRGSLKRTTQAHELLLGDIQDGRLFHANRAESTRLEKHLRRHILNARRRENHYGVSFGKETPQSNRKIDGYAALMLANTALNDLRQKTKGVRQSTGRGWFI